MASVKAESTPMRISPLGRVEGDLDLRIDVTDGKVTNAWPEVSMFRGFEIILKGKDPQAGAIVTPRICGICGGSHLYKAAEALDTAWIIGPQGGRSIHSPMEQSFIGSPIKDPTDPVEMGHVARSYDSCLVCTVHTYDGKTGRELAKFRIGEMG